MMRGRALAALLVAAVVLAGCSSDEESSPPADTSSGLTTVPIFASILRVPFAAVAPMIVVSCAIGAYAIQNAMFDIWLMLGFGVVGYVFKKIGIPLAPFTLALVLGNRAEDAFRLSMIGAGGDMKVFWSNGLVGSITTLAIVLLFWPVIDKASSSLMRFWRATQPQV